MHKSLHIINATCVLECGSTKPNSSVIIKNGLIEWTGDSKDKQPSREAVVIDARNGICLPGLINSHNHSPLMVVRGMVEDLGFAPAYTPGVPQGHWLSDEETYALSRLGLLEMLLSGATTVVDYYRKPNCLARAANELGLKAILGGRIMDADPSHLANGHYHYSAALGETSYNEAISLWEQWQGKGDGRIAVMMAPHAPDTCSKYLFEKTADLANTLNCQIHTHLAQSRQESLQVINRDGMSSVGLLEELGLLNANLIAAHCIFLNEEEITLLGSKGIVVAHVPLGNASSGNIAPIAKLAARGATITLCTDTKSGDMFESMRSAISVARIRAKGEFVLNANSVFSWATRDAAKALPQVNSASCIAAGEPADIILLDPEAPNLFPVQDAIGTVVHAGSASNVTHVICNGEILVANRKATRVDQHEVIRSAQSVSNQLWARAGVNQS